MFASVVAAEVGARRYPGHDFGGGGNQRPHWGEGDNVGESAGVVEYGLHIAVPGDDPQVQVRVIADSFAVIKDAPPRDGGVLVEAGVERGGVLHASSLLKDGA